MPIHSAQCICKGCEIITPTGTFHRSAYYNIRAVPMENVMIELPHESLLDDILNEGKIELIGSFFSNVAPGPVSPPLVCSLSFALEEADTFSFLFKLAAGIISQLLHLQECDDDDETSYRKFQSHTHNRGTSTRSHAVGLDLDLGNYRTKYHHLQDLKKRKVWAGR
jgi:hypothetical protein